MILLLALVAGAADDEGAEKEKPTGSVHGDVKSFFVGNFPYEASFLSEDPTGQGILDGRLKAEVTYGPVDFEVHHAVTTFTEGQNTTGSSFGSGVGRQAPEAVDLTWQTEGDGMFARGRTDRLVATAHGDGFDVGIGRQPISFGYGLVFTPMDLVNPFTPATVDQEYKPGVDSVRIDGFPGLSRITFAAAYAGDWDLDGMVFAAFGQTTVGVTDLSVLLGEVHADEVAGVGVSTSVGAVGITSEATVTLPDGGGDPFLRAVLGTMFTPTGGTTVTAEVYVQTIGAKNPKNYLNKLLSERYGRGELWAAGRYYAATAVSQELTPLITGSLALIANLADPSMLVAPSIAWSVSDNATASFGGFVGVGQRPDEEVQTFVGPEGPIEALVPVPNSEFGFYPGTMFIQMSAYF